MMALIKFIEEIIVINLCKKRVNLGKSKKFVAFAT